MKKTAIILALILLLSGCASHQGENRTLFAMDTVMEISIWGKDRILAVDEVEKLIRELEQQWSATLPESMLSRLDEDTVLQGEDLRFMEQVESLSKQTNGAFDPRLGSLIRAWGFLDGNYRVPTAEERQIALRKKEWNLGAVVKGYAGRRAVELLEAMDVDRAILNLGGNVQTYGQKEDGSPWIIGIQNPNGGDPVGTVSVNGTCAVVTSGDYQRYFEKDGVKYHHILDPGTGMPADSGLVSVTVISKDGVLADAMSTALMVVGLEDAIDLWRSRDDFEAVLILSDGSIYATEGAHLNGCEFQVIAREN